MQADELGYRITDASSRACPSCPWRTDCQDNEELRDRPRAVADFAYYLEEGRTRLWANWDPQGNERPSDWQGQGFGARDGYRVSCHQGNGKGRQAHWCAGADAIQHRALLRFWEAGHDEAALGPLSGLEAARLIMGELLRVDAESIDADWSITGIPVDLVELVENAHPQITDPNIAYHPFVPVATPDEVERWSRIRREGMAQSASG